MGRSGRTGGERRRKIGGEGITQSSIPKRGGEIRIPGRQRREFESRQRWLREKMRARAKLEGDHGQGSRFGVVRAWKIGMNRHRTRADSHSPGGATNSALGGAVWVDWYFPVG